MVTYLKWRSDFRASTKVPV